MISKLAAILLIGGVAFGQNRCEISFPDIKPPGATIFSAEQEGYLGEVVAEQMRRGLLIYPQAGLTEPLERISKRLLQYLPPNNYRFQFSLIELPEANAFAIPGGKIYVSRRLIAFVKDEDELAGVLAHEMGHVVARQASVDMTKAFQNILKVSSVGGRDDIFQKFNQLIDTERRKPGSAKRQEDDQLVADQVSLEAAWRAGYDPQALARFLDRLTDNKGATGGFISDLFGLTRPESKRFRELLKGVDAIPANCREARAKADEDAFRTWQKKVSELRPEDLAPSQSTLVPKLHLSPNLRPAIGNIKFSPDGKLLLAQDDSGINILRREPLEFLFRIPALGANAAMFHKDSNRVIFQSLARVEIWNLESRSRERLWQPEESLHCSGIIPSPDGRTIACMLGREVRLLDMESASEVVRHPFLIPPGGVRMEPKFSPDGASFLLGSTCCAPWAFDLNRHSELSLPRSLNIISTSFTFMGLDRIALIAQQSGVYSWPEGKLLTSFTVPPASLASVTKGPVLLLRPFREFAVGAFSIEDKQVFQISRNPALDRYDDIGATERGTGEIALYPGRKTQPIATVQLPESDLYTLRSATHSSNLEWLAISIRNRGAQWNLKTGQVIPSVPFDGGYISPEGMWTAMLEKTEPSPTGEGDKKFTARTNIDLNSQKEVNSIKFPAPEAGHRVGFSGKYEVNVTTRDNKVTVQVNDMTNSRILWSRELPELLGWYPGNAMVLRYDVKSKVAQEVFKRSPPLKKIFDAAAKASDLSLLDIVALDTGKPLGSVLFDSGGGSVIPRSVLLSGRTLFVADTNNRTLAYSLETGDRAGQQFGAVLAVDPVRGLVGIQNQPGKIAVFDDSMHAVADFEFPGNIVYAGFDGEGKRLLAVTGAQEVFIENLP